MRQTLHEIRILTIVIALALPVSVISGVSVPTLTAKAYAGSMSIGGRRMSCRLGKPVVDNKMRALGIAIPGKREFRLNRRALSRYPASFQRFVFLHECAHMYIRNERAADCWAIERGLYRGVLGRGSVNQICKALWRTPAGLYHDAGPQRCQHLKACWKSAVAKRKRR